MTVVKIILLIINIISFAVVVICLPLGIYEFFRGRQRAEEFWKRKNTSISYKTLEVIYLICLGVAFVTYIIRYFL